MSNTAYVDSDGKPRLVLSYCVFADFLGFRHEIREAIKAGQEPAAFQEFMREIEPIIQATINPNSKDEIEGFPRMWDAKIFTDNVVLGYALWSDQGEREFGHAVTQLLEFQYRVAMKGFFVRGGWAVGNLFMNRNTVFGGSLLDAYDLESKAAVYPRIVLSDEMKNLVFQHMGRYAEDPPQRYDLLMDGDGRLFTNYLSEAIDDGEVLWDDLHVHAERIRERLQESQNNDERVFQKYQWLAGYHNFFCGLVSEANGYDNSVLVSENLQLPDYGIQQVLDKERREHEPNG